MDTLIKTIIKKQLHCVFLSPHQDDAVLSCGALLAALNGKTKVSVINVFTKAHKNAYTLSAKTFMKYSNNYKSATALYVEREKEDKEVLANVGVIPQNLGLEDALFRQKGKKSFLGKLLPEFNHVYPTYRWHILQQVAKNDPALEILTRAVKRYKNKQTIVFAPTGLGNHADHRLVRLVSESLFDNLVLYSDFPYNNRLNTYGDVPSGTIQYTYKVNKKFKDTLIKGYGTQYLGLFPNGDIPKHEEVYFVAKHLLQK